MAEKRMISKVISISKKFNVRINDHFTRLLYILLIPHSDDFGRLTGDPFKVKALIIPMMSGVEWKDVEESLDKLHQAELINWYELSGEKYIQIINFDGHQQGLHKRTRSKFPDPPNYSRKFPEIPSEGKGTELNRTEEKGIEGNGSEVPAHAPDDLEKQKDDLRDLCNRMNISGFGTYQLDIVYSYIGLAEQKVIEAAIKKSENKPHTYLTNTLHGMINVDKILTAEQLPGAKAGEHSEEHGGRAQRIQSGGDSQKSPAESITGGQIGWIGRKNVIPLPNVQG